MSKTSIINIPDFGEFDEVEVIEICVSIDQKVDSEEPIIVLETDKAAMEIPASNSGVVKKILVQVGDKVQIGMPFLALDVDESPKDISDKKGVENKSKKSISENEIPRELPSAVDDAADVMSDHGFGKLNLNSQKNATVHSGPATRKLAREFGIDLNLSLIHI